MASEKLPGRSWWGRCMFHAPVCALMASSYVWGRRDPGLENMLPGCGGEQGCCWGLEGQGGQMGHELHCSAREGARVGNAGQHGGWGGSACCSPGPLIAGSLGGHFQQVSWGCHRRCCGLAACCGEPPPAPSTQDTDHHQVAVVADMPWHIALGKAVTGSYLDPYHLHQDAHILHGDGANVLAASRITWPCPGRGCR